ncbi:uncharacterized protein METZ01_LOCUS324565 [marine metagenome]|uniref:Uncharacterized protein n=1 Tax=marine metagenome TaxID=408172 RepID=A0A382PIE9_9ZZZZ
MFIDTSRRKSPSVGTLVTSARIPSSCSGLSSLVLEDGSIPVASQIFLAVVAPMP